MGLESATYISELNEAWPLGTDGKNTLDNHARMTKAVLKNTFPNIGAAAVTGTAAQINAAVASGGLSTVSSSTTSLAISIAVKALTVEAGKGFAAGQSIQLTYDTSNFMTGICVSYVTGTGALSVNVTAVTGSGTYADWDVFVIVPTAPFPDNSPLVKDSADTTKQAIFNAGNISTGTTRTYDLPDKSGGVQLSPLANYVSLAAGNGHGSTNTKIRRFTTLLGSAGTALTYADSASLGATVTVNEAGLYEVYYLDAYSAGASVLGASVNSNELTTNVTSITDAHRIANITTAASGAPLSFTRTIECAVNDVIRPHTNGVVDATTAPTSMFAVRKIA